MRLLSHEGEFGKIRHAPRSFTEPIEHFEAARYYHVRVSNEWRFISPARDVQVFLTRVEEPGPGGTLQPTWVGQIPVTWRNPSISPVIRTIGHEYDCDLCSVGENRWLSLSPLIIPFNLNVRRDAPCTMVVWLQAKSVQTDSPVCRIQLAWDGQWDPGENEMKRHLVLTELPSSG